MVVLYDTGGEFLPVMEELIKKVERDTCEEVYRCGTLSECARHLDNDKAYVMDMRLVQKSVYDEIDFCSEETLNTIYDMISPVSETLGKPNRNLLYVLVLPESWINETDYICDSLMANLNLLKGTNYRPLPKTHRTYVNNNPDIAYTFTVLSRKAIVDARHASIQKAKKGKN